MDTEVWVPLIYLIGILERLNEIKHVKPLLPGAQRVSPTQLAGIKKLYWRSGLNSDCPFKCPVPQKPTWSTSLIFAIYLGPRVTGLRKSCLGILIPFPQVPSITQDILHPFFHFESNWPDLSSAHTLTSKLC